MEEQGLAVVDPYQMMDRKDDDQIVAQMKGAILKTCVYSFKQGGKTIEGLSKVGVDEACRELAKKGEAIRELELSMDGDTEDYALFKAKAGRYLVDPKNDKEYLFETKIGQKRQAKFYPKGGSYPHWYETGGQKALRNARRDLIPKELEIALIAKWKKEGKVEYLEDSPPPPKKKTIPKAPVMERDYEGWVKEFKECGSRAKAGDFWRAHEVNFTKQLNPEETTDLQLAVGKMYPDNRGPDGTKGDFS